MTNGYERGLTIERKDNDGNYCPENCIFIPKAEQSKNRRGLHLINYKGEIKTLSEWARIYSIDRKTISDRLDRNWNIEEALNAPINNPKLEVSRNEQ